jgi:nucleotide-binding universal stress UspA family protein
VRKVFSDATEQIVLEAQRYDLVLLGQQTYFHFETQEGPGDTLVVMGAYGRSTWREFLFGSVTRHVLRDSPVPVFFCITEAACRAD